LLRELKVLGAEKLVSEQPSMPERPKGPRGKSLVTKRSIRLNGHKTSVTLKSVFWTAFKEIAAAQETSVVSLRPSTTSDKRAPIPIFRPQSVCSSSIIVAVDAALSGPTPVRKSRQPWWSQPGPKRLAAVLIARRRVQARMVEAVNGEPAHALLAHVGEVHRRACSMVQFHNGLVGQRVRGCCYRS
jgi:predicted DNA-binding ribbon-helix-helix protein